MKIDIDELMKNSFVISINNIQLKKFNDTFLKCGFKILPRAFSGYTIKNGFYKEYGMIKTKNHCNCSLSHMSIVKMAKCLNLPFVCIFEDDSVPTKTIQIDLQSILSDIDDDIDAIKMGIINFTQCSKIDYSDKFFISNDTIGGHAYIIFQKYYDTYEKLSSVDIRPDTLVLNSKNNKILTCKKNLFIQYNLDIGNALHKDQPLRCNIGQRDREKVLSEYVL